MSQNPEDPFAAWRSMRDSTMDAWSKSMIDMVNQEAFAEGLGAWLDNYLTVSAPLRKSMETTMTQVLEQFNMPSRNEVTRIAERLTNIEMRLDDLDAKLDALRGVSEKPSAGARGGSSKKDR